MNGMRKFDTPLFHINRLKRHHENRRNIKDRVIDLCTEKES